MRPPSPPFSKASTSHMREHNRHMILRAIQAGVANHRAALADVTGLTKPTVTDLVGELLDDGILREAGYGSSTGSGGKPPRILELVATARQVIGITLLPHTIQGVLTNLDGTISAEQQVVFATPPAQFELDVLLGVINGLVAQLDAPLVCIGVGIPGTVDYYGTLRFDPQLGWERLPLAFILEQNYAVAVYIENNIKLTALAQFAFGPTHSPAHWVTLVVDDTVAVGSIAGQQDYGLAQTIGWLSPSPQHPTLAATLSTSAVQARLLTLWDQHPPRQSLPKHANLYLTMRHGLQQGDRACQLLYAELVAEMAHVVAWVVAMLQPDYLGLVGPLADLGGTFIADVRHQLTEYIPATQLEHLHLSAGRAVPRLSAQGAIAYALHQHLGLTQWRTVLA